MKFSTGHQPAGPGGTPFRRAVFKAASAVTAGVLVLGNAGVVLADDIYNTIDGTIDPVAEVMPLNVGVDGTTALQIQPRGQDGEPGCNVKNDYSVTVSLVSSDPSVATVPASLFIGDCTPVPLTVTPLKAGTTTVTVSVAINNSPGSFNVAPATFRVDVAPPANTAPVLSISGVTQGTSYAKGSVPTAVCVVTDTEDGPSTRAATLSPITGPDAATGVGSQEATCEYKDAGGLYVRSSVTYNIADATAPVISYTLNPLDPAGDNGWYLDAVSLDWTVTEDDAPSTLVLAGCADQIITEDQVATSYSCSATSSGGSAGPQTVTLKKDGTAPGVEFTSATGTKGNNGWYTSAVEATFTGTDATSGLETVTRSVTSSGQGPGVKVSSPAFTDYAGNTTGPGADSATFNIDWAAPLVTYEAAATAAPNGNGWYNSNVVATFSATDATSGLASPTTRESSSDGEGAAVVVQSPVFTDIAGNASLPGAAVSAAFKIDKTAPTAAFDSTLGESYYGATPAAPTCTASDGLSGPESCVVSGYRNTVGTHTLTATATDRAGNTATATQAYTVRPWTLTGFYQPIDMNGVLNAVKGGSTVPAKFEAFVGGAEITDPSLMKFTMATMTCSLNVLVDDIETTVAGSTSLRYDATAGQFVYNWKTPTGAGNCYRLTMTAQDGSSISANFKLK